MASVETKHKFVWTLVWRIENFSYWDKECHGEKIISPKSPNRVFQWYLHLFPKGKEEGDQHLHVQIQLCDLMPRVHWNFELSFLDGNKTALTTVIVRNQEFKNGIPLDLHNCPTQEEVFQSNKSFLPHDTLTVLGRLWIFDPNRSIDQHMSARSRIDIREETILFRPGILRNLQLDQEKNFFVKLNLLTSINKTLNCTYTLRGTSLANSVVNFQICTTNDDEPFLITCKLSLLNNERKTIKCVEEKHMFNRSTDPQIWLFPHFLPRQELLENNDIDRISTKIIANSSNISGIFECSFVGFVGFEMECDLPRDDVPTTSEKCIQTTQQNGNQPDSIQHRMDSATILGEDLLSIYKDQTLSDFQLLSGDVSFPVHKIVLSARSPVFRNMFCGDMRKVDSTSLDDVDAQTLNQMLTFLYSGRLDDMKWEDAAKLYCAAHKYQILSLKKECSSLMRSIISVSNVCVILVLAQKHQDTQLIFFMYDYILIHYDDVVLSDEWNKFLDSYPQIAGKIMTQIYKKKVQL